MELIEDVLRAANLTQASKEVIRNKGAGGLDRMSVIDLKEYLDINRETLINQIHKQKYIPQPIRGKEIPKGNGKFRMLGIRKGEKGKYQLVVTKKRWKALKMKLKEITRKTSPMSFDERIVKLNQVTRGWINYFKYASISQKLREIDGWLRNRLRYCIWTDWKKPERKRKNLIRLGIPNGQAYAWSRTRMGGWAVAQSPIPGTTITLERLRKRAYVSMFSLYQKMSTSNYKNSLFPFI